MAASKPQAETRTVAKFTGFHGTRRVISVADQNKLVGVESGVGKEDLIWEPGNSKIDVTNVHPDVLEHLRHDSEFRVSTVEVTPEAPTS
jgi:hypothetical protein